MIIEPPYKLSELQLSNLPSTVRLHDHLMGFDQFRHNQFLDKLNEYSQINNTRTTVFYHQILDPEVKKNYPNLDLIFTFEPFKNSIWTPFATYTRHPNINHTNFICSFNGSAHVSRQLLTSILQKFGYFNSEYCSKNFSYSIDALDGHIKNYVSTRDRLYRKFFISDNSEEFFQTTYSFGHVQFDHANNIYNLENKLTESFLHVVSETLATSYYPFVTEKFLYSIVTHGLFITYAQPGWHTHLEKYYGFKKYTKLFDYRFDTIQNPVERLVELVSMISKFSVLSKSDWHDLYLMEYDTIQHNYNWYMGGSYLTHLQKYEN
jgi:hypothetical protein